MALEQTLRLPIVATGCAVRRETYDFEVITNETHPGHTGSLIGRVTGRGR
jgi:hypothetical protein